MAGPRLAAVTTAVDGGAAQPEEIGLPEYSDDALAMRLAERLDHKARYVPPWGKWMFFSGARWSPDRMLTAVRRAREICAEGAADVMADRRLTEKQRSGLAASIQSAPKIYAVEKLARSDAHVATVTECWDRDPWLLNTPGGTVDLKTGVMREHRAADFITKCTRVAPGGTCPEWFRFLARVTGGDPELSAYLRRVFGYALTGLTIDHALFFLYGTGANGKSSLLSALLYVLGDYAAVAPMETFIETHGERHPADLAMLMGARLVVASETEQGRRWAASKIKQLTGGEPISARFMRMDYFTYTPQFKLVLSGNHRPGLRNVDESVRRRFNLVPFAQTIPFEERDPTLPDKLKAEAPGILAWMIQGCLEWQVRGLDQPLAVRSATDSYLADEDTFSSWIEDCCEREAGTFSILADLHQAYRRWAAKAGERELGSKSFSQQLEERGFERARHPQTRARGFLGIRPKQAAMDLP